MGKKKKPGDQQQMASSTHEVDTSLKHNLEVAQTKETSEKSSAANISIATLPAVSSQSILQGKDANVDVNVSSQDETKDKNKPLNEMLSKLPATEMSTPNTHLPKAKAKDADDGTQHKENVNISSENVASTTSKSENMSKSSEKIPESKSLSEEKTISGDTSIANIASGKSSIPSVVSVPLQPSNEKNKKESQELPVLACQLSDKGKVSTSECISEKKNVPTIQTVGCAQFTAQNSTTKCMEIIKTEASLTNMTTAETKNLISSPIDFKPVPVTSENINTLVSPKGNISKISETKDTIDNKMSVQNETVIRTVKPELQNTKDVVKLSENKAMKTNVLQHENNTQAEKMNVSKNSNETKISAGFTEDNQLQKPEAKSKTSSLSTPHSLLNKEDINKKVGNASLSSEQINILENERPSKPNLTDSVLNTVDNKIPCNVSNSELSVLQKTPDLKLKCEIIPSQERPAVQKGQIESKIPVAQLPGIKSNIPVKKQDQKTVEGTNLSKDKKASQVSPKDNVSTNTKQKPKLGNDTQTQEDKRKESNVDQKSNDESVLGDVKTTEGTKTKEQPQTELAETSAKKTDIKPKVEAKTTSEVTKVKEKPRTESPEVSAKKTETKPKVETKKTPGVTKQKEQLQTESSEVSVKKAEIKPKVAVKATSEATKSKELSLKESSDVSAKKTEIKPKVEAKLKEQPQTESSDILSKKTEGKSKLEVTSAQPLSGDIATKKPNLKEKGVSKKKVSDNFSKPGDLLSKISEKTALSTEVAEVTSFKDKENYTVNNQASSSNEKVESKKDESQGSLKKTQKSAELLGEAKIEESNKKSNSISTEVSYNTPAAVKVTNGGISVTEVTPSKEQEGKSASRKTKTKISKQKDKIKTSESGAKTEGTTNLLGVVQNVIDVIGNDNESSGIKGDKKQADPSSQEYLRMDDSTPKDDKDTTNKSNKSRNKKKNKAKSGESQEKHGDNTESVNPHEGLEKETQANTTQKEQKKTYAIGDEGTDSQVMKLESEGDKVNKPGKSKAKPKKVKGNTDKRKELVQCSDKTEQIATKCKTSQPSEVNLGNKKEDNGKTTLDIQENNLTTEDSLQKKKKKRKRRSNKGKQSATEGEKETGVDKENNKPQQGPEGIGEEKKNFNKINVGEKINIGDGSEEKKKTQTKNVINKVKQDDTKQQKLSGKLSEEQLTNLTKTAVNLSHSFGDSEKFDMKFTPDLMQCLLAPKPTNILSSAEDEGEVEYRLVQRQIFLSYVCHVCKSMENIDCNLKKCNSCKLISYCSKKHQKDHWAAHKDMCIAITNICKRDGLSHLFEKAKSLTPDDYRLYRTHYVNICAQELGRDLQLWEKEMIYYPQVCQTCYEYDMNKLNICSSCNHINYCNAGHRKINHDIWCKEFQIYRDITLHQFHNGMIRPVLPEKNFPEYTPLTGDMESFLSKVYNITEKSVHMSKLHFVTLTDVATCPFTILYSLENCEISLKDTNSLVVHLIGAEMFFEIDNIRKWEVLFLHLVPSVKSMKIVFVGPELNVDNVLMKSLSETRVCHTCNTSGKSILYEFWPGLYHNFMDTKKYGKPDLICAFNAGLYRATDYERKDTWSPTIEKIFKNTEVPVVVTEYTEQELPLDIARIQSLNSNVKVVMSPSRNPFSSLKPSLNFLSEESVPVIFKNFYITIVKSSKV